MSEPTHDRGKTLYIAVFAAMVTSALTTYGLRALEGGGFGGEEEPETVEVPSVTGLARATAQELVQTRGLRFVVADEAPSAEHEAGNVASQEPLAGSQVPADSAVNVVVSSGPPQVEIPDLVGRPLADAREALEELGLEIGDVDETGEGDPPGSVTALDPEPGAEVEVGTEVDLTASPSGVTVPDLLNESYRQAREQLEELGHEVQVRRRWVESRREFAVLAMEPEPGTVVPPGSEVQITIND